MSNLSHILSPSTSPATDTAPRARVRRIVEECAGSDLSSWEKHEFLPCISNQFALTTDQEKVLADIERRVFGDADA